MQLTNDNLIHLEWVAKSTNSSFSGETILTLIERVRFLSERNTEFQERNTELVIQNRKLALALNMLEAQMLNLYE